MTEMYLDKIWSTIPSPLILIDRNDLILAINPAAELLFNVSNRNIKGSHFNRRLGPNTLLIESLLAVRDSQTTAYISNINIEIAERLDIECNLQLSILTDTTDCILIKLDIREMDDSKVQILVSPEASYPTIGLLETLSHEVKNPLAGIIGAAQLLSMNLTPKDNKLIDLIVEESRRIEETLSHIGQFGEFKPISKKPENIHLILERARKIASYGFASNVVIKEKYDPSLPNVLGDFDLLLQTFLNIFKNSVEASINGSIIIEVRTFYENLISIKNNNGESIPAPLNVEIRDNGKGFSKEILAKAFQPFVSSKENGSGLGLALVSRIIREHNGWISIKSNPGDTVIRISLPIIKKKEDK